MAFEKTIGVNLLDGTPFGRRQVTLPDWKYTLTCIPRSDLPACTAMEKLHTPGLCFFFGHHTGTQQPFVFMDRGEDTLGILLKPRDFERPGPGKENFWSEAVVLTDSEGSLSAVELQYLASRFQELASKAGRYQFLNPESLSLPSLSPEEKAPLEECIPNVAAILPQLGYPLFQPLPSRLSPEGRDSRTLFFSVEENLTASGRLDPQGFWLLEGSYLRPDSDEHLPPEVRKLREDLSPAIRDHLLRRDILLSGPSLAASLVSGTPTEGLTAWKTSRGSPLWKILGLSSPDADRDKDKEGSQSKQTPAPPVQENYSEPKVLPDRSGQLLPEFTTAILHLASSEIRAFGQGTQDGFLVRKGSQVRNAKTSCPKKIQDLRMDQRRLGSLRGWTLNRDILFSDPSAAAAFLLGRVPLEEDRWVSEDGTAADGSPEETQIMMKLPESSKSPASQPVGSGSAPLSPDPAWKLPPIQDLLRLTDRGANALAYQRRNGFFVLQGSTIAAKADDSCPENLRTLRRDLQTRKVIRYQVLTQNVPFSGSRDAACFVLGTDAEGDPLWKNLADVTLEELLKQPEPEPQPEALPETQAPAPQETPATQEAASAPAPETQPAATPPEPQPEPEPEPQPEPPADPTLLHLDSTSLQASCRITPEGYLLLKGSQLADPDMAYCPDNIRADRLTCIHNGSIQDDVITKDILFRTPSEASSFILGRRSNGNDVWLNTSNVTLGLLLDPLPLPEGVTFPPDRPNGNPVLRLNDRKILAFGFQQGTEFVVLKGSHFWSQEMKSCLDSVVKMRKMLLSSNTVQDLVFTRDALFPNALIAASCICGATRSSLTLWLRRDGVMLKHLPPVAREEELSPDTVIVTEEADIAPAESPEPATPATPEEMAPESPEPGATELPSQVPPEPQPAPEQPDAASAETPEGEAKPAPAKPASPEPAAPEPQAPAQASPIASPTVTPGPEGKSQIPEEALAESPEPEESAQPETAAAPSPGPAAPEPQGLASAELSTSASPEKAPAAEPASKVPDQASMESQEPEEKALPEEPAQPEGAAPASPDGVPEPEGSSQASDATKALKRKARTKSAKPKGVQAAEPDSSKAEPSGEPSPVPPAQDQILHLVGARIAATGKLLPKGFLVFQGSQVWGAESASCPKATRAQRKACLEDGTIRDGILTRDVEFNSPSAAASFLYGRSSNGPNEWVTSDGIRLKDLRR